MAHEPVMWLVRGGGVDEYEPGIDKRLDEVLAHSNLRDNVTSIRWNGLKSPWDCADERAYTQYVTSQVNPRTGKPFTTYVAQALWWFVREMKPDDIVVMPYDTVYAHSEPVDGKVAIGRVIGQCIEHSDAPADSLIYPRRTRAVDWQVTDRYRHDFVAARQRLSQHATIRRVVNHEQLQEILSMLPTPVAV